MLGRMPFSVFFYFLAVWKADFVAVQEDTLIKVSPPQPVFTAHGLTSAQFWLFGSGRYNRAR